MSTSVESFCNVLARSKLLPVPTILALRKRWLDQAGPHGQDVDRFLQWLAAEGTVTEYQIGFLQRGHAEQLFLSPYTLRDRIGKGRMAGIYKAVHPTGATVAIKILPPSKARDPLILARFQREAKLALRLNHPNIVRTFHVGEQGKLHFLVMECLEGDTLDEVVRRRGKLSPGEAIRLGRQVLLGLHQIHGRRLIHRDIKPGNLMLVGGDGRSTLSDVLKILDIGTGRSTGAEEGPNTELTNEGDMLGTPQFMSPEQARDPRKADIRADLYSLGCVFYHMLAGQPPFVDANPVRLLVRHATEPPKSLRQINPHVPENLEAIINRLLAKDPAQRFATPERAFHALRVFPELGVQPVPLDRDPRMTVYLKWLATEFGGGIVEAQIPPPRADLPAEESADEVVYDLEEGEVEIIEEAEDDVELVEDDVELVEEDVEILDELEEAPEPPRRSARAPDRGRSSAKPKKKRHRSRDEMEEEDVD
jgi:serine/threonine protein kinase